MKHGSIRSALSLVTGLVIGLVVASTALAQAPSGYYDTVDTTDSNTLRSSLHEVIDDHTRFPYTSSATDTWNILELADEDPTNSGRILDVYRNASYAKEGGGNSFYNREHTWPKSYGFPNDNSSNYPYTDCHHLFLCDDGYNSSRSNKPYRYCDPSCGEKTTDFNFGQGGGSGFYPGNSSWTSGSNTSGTWEVWINRRGDIARALMYMDVRYEGGTHNGTGISEPDLILTDNESLIASGNTGSNENVAYMGMLSVLLQWHAEDPVDSLEMWRNDQVFNHQGNRNPFIDNPAWIDCIFGTACGGGRGGRGGRGGGSGDAWINEFHYDNSSGDVGEFVEIAGTAGTDLTGWQVVAYNGNGGATYSSISLGGTLPDQGGCIGALDYTFTGLQNGSPDGIALVDDSGAVIEFLSYEGVIVAVDGPASGMTSTDIGVSETGSTPVGYSLQRGGTGAAAGDFTWQSAQFDTPGLPNTGQTFSGGCGGGGPTPPAAPTGFTATAGDAQVDLAWSANSEPDLQGYIVYRSQTSGSGYVAQTGVISATSYLDTSVINGTTYYYVVTALDTDAEESANSGETSATPEAPPTGPTVLAFDDFESGWGSYSDGGSDCRRYTGGTHAWQGNDCLAIQDNSGTKSSFTLTNGIDVATPGYTSIEVDFYFKAVSMENGEDFWVQFWDGSTWQTVQAYVRGTHFNNNTFYQATVTIDEASYNFPTDMKIRFRCDASSNADDVYIDEITISAE